MKKKPFNPAQISGLVYFFGVTSMPRRRFRWQACKAKKIKDSPEIKFDKKLRQGLESHRNRLFELGDFPASNIDRVLLLTCGLGEFLVGVVEEEERFRLDWERRS